MEHEMKGCSSPPRVRFATLCFDVQRLRRKETGIDRYPYPEWEDRKRAVPSSPTREVISDPFLSANGYEVNVVDDGAHACCGEKPRFTLTALRELELRLRRLFLLERIRDAMSYEIVT